MPLLSGGRPHPLSTLAAGALLALGESGCYRVPLEKRAVESVTIDGTHGIDQDELEGRIATRESSRFLGLFEGVVYEYEVFDPYALRRDLQRIERFLRARGWYEAQVKAARVEERGQKVYVTITVDQGAPVLVDAISFVENSPVDAKTREATRKQVASVLPIGALFDEDKFEEAEAAALKGLTSTGHAAAKVTRRSEVDLLAHRARMSFAIDPGPLGQFGKVEFIGLGELPEESVRRVFGVEPATRYSSAALEEGKQALLDLGVFASIEIEQDLSKFSETNGVPVRVRATPSKIRAFLAGGGIELDSLKADAHLQVGWQNGNFLGGLRKLDVRYKPGIVLYPTRFPELNPPTNPLYEHRLNATLRQPAFVEKRTVGFTRGEYNVYPVLLSTPTQDVLGYHELRGEVGVERSFFKYLFVSPEYDFQLNTPFGYLGKVDSSVETLLISYIGVTTSLDFRDDPIKPRRGVWLSNELQLAGGPLLRGDASDIRVRPEIRGFIPLPRKITIALRGSVGFLFPSSYSQFSQINFESDGPSRAEAAARDYQLLFFRGFFGGGPSSNRGYPLRGIGPHDVISYLTPAAQAASSCSPGDAGCRLPIGGLSLWETSAEIRFVVSGPFSTAAFCDAGDVSPFRTNIRLERPHLSCGGGARYDTPVGPIRLDVGYRIPGLQFPGGASYESVPPDLLNLPIAIAFGIGEAF